MNKFIKKIVTISIIALSNLSAANIQATKKTETNTPQDTIIWLLAGHDEHFGPRFLKNIKHMSWFNNPIIETGEYYQLFEQKINALIEQDKTLTITLKDMDYDDRDSLTYDQDEFTQLAKLTDHLRKEITSTKNRKKTHMIITYNNTLGTKAMGLLSQILTQDEIQIKTQETTAQNEIIDSIKTALKENLKIPKDLIIPAQIYHININLFDYQNVLTDLQAVLIDGLTPEFEVPLFAQKNFIASYNLDKNNSAKICSNFNIKYPDKYKSYNYISMLFPCNKKSRNQIITEIAGELAGTLIQNVCPFFSTSTSTCH